MKKVLLITFACKPNEGSESGVGWNFVKLIGGIEELDVYVLAWSGENQKKLLSENKEVNVKYIFYDLPPFISKYQNKQTHNGQKFMEIYYMLWQVGALKYIVKKFGRNYFDIVHHITFVSATLPSLFVLLKAKFIWGPLSSNDVTPKVLLNKRNKINKLVVKDYFKKVVRKLSFVYKLDKYKSEKILINTSDITDIVKLKNTKKIIQVSSIGVEAQLLNNNYWLSKSQSIKEEVRIFSVGKFIDIKNFDLTIEAFYKFSQIHKNSKLYLVGDGPNKQSLLNLVREYKIEDRVIFMGWQSRQDVIDLLSYKSHILLYPTAEKAGITILEALALGNPVVGLNFGGPKEFVKKDSGILVELEERDLMSTNLAQALIEVINNYENYSKNTYKAVYPYLWENRDAKMKDIYNSILL